MHETLIHFSENVTGSWIRKVVSSEQMRSNFCSKYPFRCHPHTQIYKEADWAKSHCCTCVAVFVFLFVALFHTIGGVALEGGGCILPLPPLIHTHAHAHISLHPIYTTPFYPLTTVPCALHWATFSCSPLAVWVKKKKSLMTEVALQPCWFGPCDPSFRKKKKKGQITN